MVPKLRGRADQLAHFIAYWNSMRKGGDVPRRSAIDPRRIDPLLENALIAERIAPGLARLRIAGMHLTELMGMEVRGMPVSAFISPNDRPALAQALTDLFERPAMIDMVLAAPGGRGKGALCARLVLLPLRSDLGDISRALGVLISDGQIGIGPRRFDICSSKITPLDLPAGGSCAAGFSETHAPVVDAKPQSPSPTSHKSERSYLRLVR
jgi:hypothetical protein